MPNWRIITGLFLAALALTVSATAQEEEVAAPEIVPLPEGREYILTAAKPDRMYVIDIAERRIEREYTIPGPIVAPGTFFPSPDGKTAYMLTNHDRSVVGIDLDTGETVFWADLSQDEDVRVKNFGLAISPDGRELFAYEAPTRLHDDRYEIMDTRISVYETGAGLDAAPVRQFPAPRRIGVMTMSRDGSALYAFGWDFYRIDPQTGAVETAVPMRNWQRENMTPPDALTFWDLSEQSGIYAANYVAMRTDLPPEDINSFVFGMLTADLQSGEAGTIDIAIEPQILFTSVLSPDRKFAYSTYLNLLKLDMTEKRQVASVELDHTYYFAQVSGDGSEVYLGGNLCDIAIYSAETLEKTGQVLLPECHEMGAAPLRMFRR